MKFGTEISSSAVTTIVSRLATVFIIALLIVSSLSAMIHVSLGQYYPVYHGFQEDHPSDRENGWSGEIQGVAHDQWNWFFTQKDFLLKFPVWFDLDQGVDRRNFGRSINDYEQLAPFGSDHFGDLDQWQGLLFIPVEGGGHQVLGVFNASDLNFVYVKDLSAYQTHSAWVAINHQQSILYTSDGTAPPLLRYDLDIAKLLSENEKDQGITYKDTFPLFETNGESLQPELGEWMQGGVFDPYGNLYLVNGHARKDAEDVRGGIHLFDSNGRLIVESTNGYGTFNYEYHPEWHGGWEEPEGIDWWNLGYNLGGESPWINGQLHAIMLDNLDGALYFKHYIVNYDIPMDTDSDRDGQTDFKEIKHNSDPLIAPPRGSLTIEWNGNEDKAKGMDVTLYVTSYDETSEIEGERPSRIRFSDDLTDWTEWKPYYSVFPWTLSGNAGLKTAYCEVENKAGLVSYFHDSIYFTNAKHTKLFFNINPNPAIEHESVELKGTVIDEEGSPVPRTLPELYFGRVEITYYDSTAEEWASFDTLSVNQDGTFSTTIRESPELDLSGNIIFNATYIAGDDYFDSQAETLLRFISTEVRSPESSHSLYFNLWLTGTVKGWPARLTGCLRDETGSPEIGASVTVYYSVDDGASWQFEETAQTDPHGIFVGQIETDAFGPSSPLDEPQPVLIRASHLIGVSGPALVEIYKTAYLTVGTLPLERLYPVVQIHIPHMPIPLGRVRYMPYEIQVGLPTTAAYDVRFSDTTSLRLNGTIPVGPECISYRDTNGDGLLDLTLTMNRTVLTQFILSRNMTTGSVTLFLTGRFYDNVMFGGTIIVTVRMPGDINVDGKVDIRDVAQAATVFGTYDGHSRWNPVADENEDGQIDIRDLVSICKKFGTRYI